MRGNKGIIGNRQSYSLSDNGAIGVHNTFDQYNARKDNRWPTVKKFVSCSPNSGTYNEGSTITFTITVDGYENTNTVYYSIVAVSGTINTSDFADSATTGSFTVNASGVGSFSKTLTLDATSETTDSFKVEIRDGSTSGTIIGESGTFTITNPSFSITPSSGSFNEGSSITWNVSTTNVNNGTTLYYSYGGTPANSNDISSSLTGSFTINSNSGSFTTISRNDFTTEGNETLTAYVRIGSTSGTIAASNTVTINDTSLTPTATITPSTGSINEGSSVTFTVNTTNFASGTLDWDTILSADMETVDINNTSGTVSISGSTGSIVITATSDGFTETGQTESFQVRILSPAIPSTGGILTTSSAVTINDTSTGTAEPVGTDITSSFYEISNRHIDSDTYMGSTADYNGPYDVGEVQTDFSGSGRVYIGIKVTASTTFYNDIAIAGVQVLNSAGNTIIASWIFHSSTGGSGSTWETYTSQIAGTSTVGFPVTPATASGYTYSSIVTGSTLGRFNWATSTGSSYTGAADGISSSYVTTIASVGDAQITQTSGTYYAYAETSSSTRYYGAVMRSPAITFSGGEKIRVIHALTGYSISPMDPDDSLYVAVY